MLAQILNQTAGIGIGTFLGVGLGLSLRAHRGKRGGLVRDSVWMTAVLAGMVAWVAMALVTAVIG